MKFSLGIPTNPQATAKIGTVFYKKLKDALDGLEIKKIYVSALEDNHSGEPFFKSAGFRQKTGAEKGLKILEADV